MERRNDFSDPDDNSQINLQMYLEEIQTASLASVRRFVYRLFTRVVVDRHRRGVVEEESKTSYLTLIAHAKLRKVAQAAAFLQKLKSYRQIGGQSPEANRRLAIAEALIEKTLKRGALKFYLKKLAL